MTITKGAGMASQVSDGQLKRKGGKRHQGYMGRARIYANRTHGLYAKAKDQPRDKRGRWATSLGNAAATQAIRDKVKRLNSLRADNAEDFGRAASTFFRRVAQKVVKDLSAGDVHSPTALGNETPRRRRPRLSLARIPNMSLQEYVQKRFFSAKHRRHDAKTGAAMPGGRFPIENAHDLANAERLEGHASDKKAVEAHIRSRARALGIPLHKNWQGFDQTRGRMERTAAHIGTAVSVYHAPKFARIARRAALKVGASRGAAVGAAGLGAYAAIQGATTLAGYVGRKLDQRFAKDDFAGLMNLLNPNATDPQPFGGAVGLISGRGAANAGPNRAGMGPDIVKDELKRAVGRKTRRSLKNMEKDGDPYGGPLQAGLASRGQSESEVLNTPGRASAVPSWDPANSVPGAAQAVGTRDTQAGGGTAPWESSPGVRRASPDQDI